MNQENTAFEHPVSRLAVVANALGTVQQMVTSYGYDEQVSVLTHY
jgi:hypothetical protein